MPFQEFGSRHRGHDGNVRHERNMPGSEDTATSPRSSYLYENYKSEDFLRPLSDSILSTLTQDQLQQILFCRQCLQTALSCDAQTEANQMTTHLRVLFNDIAIMGHAREGLLRATCCSIDNLIDNLIFIWT